MSSPCDIESRWPTTTAARQTVVATDDCSDGMAIAGNFSKCASVGGRNGPARDERLYMTTCLLSLRWTAKLIVDDANKHGHVRTEKVWSLRPRKTHSLVLGTGTAMKCG